MYVRESSICYYCNLICILTFSVSLVAITIHRIEELQRSVVFFSRANSTLKQQNDELARVLMHAQTKIAEIESGQAPAPAAAAQDGTRQRSNRQVAPQSTLNLRLKATLNSKHRRKLLLNKPCMRVKVFLRLLLVLLLKR